MNNSKYIVSFNCRGAVIHNEHAVHTAAIKGFLKITNF